MVVAVRLARSSHVADCQRTLYDFGMAQRGPAASQKPEMKRAPSERTSRAKQLTAAFQKGVKRAVSAHAAAGRSVYGKVDGRLAEVRPAKRK